MLKTSILKRATKLAVWSAAVSLIAVLIPGPQAGAPSAWGAANECNPLVIMAFRGSGEEQKGVEDLDDPFESIENTDGWEGPAIHRVLRGYEVAVGSEIASRVRVIDVGDETDPDTEADGYPSIGVWDGAVYPPNVLASAQHGADEAAARMETVWREEDKSCLATKFILIGFSQGAIAARMVGEMYPNDIAGSILLGDPLQAADQAVNEGEGSSGWGMVRSVIPPFHQVQSDRYYDLPYHQSSLCHEKDPVCNFSFLSTLEAMNEGYPDHNNYSTIGSNEAASKAAELSELVLRFLDATVPTPKDSPTDILFVLNHFSGRWEGNPQRQYLMNSLDSLFELMADRPNVRVGVQVIGWSVLSPTSDTTDIRSFMDSISDSYNPYPRQYQQPFIYEAIDNPAFFRSEADQVIIGLEQYSADNEGTAEWNSSLDSAIAENVAMERPNVITAEGVLMSPGSVQIYNAPGAQDPNDGYYIEGYGEESPFEAIYSKVFDTPRASMGIPSILLAGQNIPITGRDSFNAESIEITIHSGEEGESLSRTLDPQSNPAGPAIVTLKATSVSGKSSIVRADVTIIDPASMKIPWSPLDGAEPTDAVLVENPSSAGLLDLSMTLEDGESVEVRVVANPDATANPFTRSDSTRIDAFNAPLDGGSVVRPLSGLENFPSGSFALLIATSTGEMSILRFNR
jgi:hypothetical protein